MRVGTIFNPWVYRVSIATNEPCSGCGQHHGTRGTTNGLDGVTTVLEEFFPGITEQHNEYFNERQGVAGVCIESASAKAVVARIPFLVALGVSAIDMVQT